jgi:hypothetical protein
MFWLTISYRCLGTACCLRLQDRPRRRLSIGWTQQARSWQLITNQARRHTPDDGIFNANTFTTKLRTLSPLARQPISVNPLMANEPTYSSNTGFWQHHFKKHTHELSGNCKRRSWFRDSILSDKQMNRQVCICPAVTWVCTPNKHSYKSPVTMAYTMLHT